VTVETVEIVATVEVVEIVVTVDADVDVDEEAVEALRLRTVTAGLALRKYSSSYQSDKC
jgi:hypothetical protein